jgi:hypothetical protein
MGPLSGKLERSLVHDVMNHGGFSILSLRTKFHIKIKWFLKVFLGTTIKPRFKKLASGNGQGAFVFS